jgi:hypothetical protein
MFLDYNYTLVERNTFNTGSYSAAGAGAFGPFTALTAGLFPPNVQVFMGRFRIDSASFSGTSRGISFFGAVFTMSSSTWSVVPTFPALCTSQEIATSTIFSTQNYSNAVVVQAGTGTFNVTGMWELWGIRGNG